MKRRTFLHPRRRSGLLGLARRPGASGALQGVMPRGGRRRLRRRDRGQVRAPAGAARSTWCWSSRTRLSSPARCPTSWWAARSSWPTHDALRRGWPRRAGGAGQRAIDRWRSRSAWRAAHDPLRQAGAVARRRLHEFGGQGLQAAAAGQILQPGRRGRETVALRAARGDAATAASTRSRPQAPYRCPPGPTSAPVVAYFKHAKPRSKVLILDANPDVTSKGALFKKALGRATAA